jgi:predicted exporter
MTTHLPAHARHRDRIGARRAHEVRLITTVLAAVCALGFLAAVIPGVEAALTVGLLALAGLVLVGLTVRYAARWVRERREDRQDAVTAARWRAIHAPHLLDDHGQARTVAGAVRGVA